MSLLFLTLCVTRCVTPCHQVSENFVVATKRVKHAIKSDIPSITDHVGKIVHIGKATVDKLLDLRAAAAEEKLEVDFPDHLNRIEKVGAGCVAGGVGSVSWAIIGH
jgi:hypothetical protein